MKITPAILSIPPYLSTSWKNISTLHVEEELHAFRLIVTLQNKVQIEIPGLDQTTLDAIFEAHAKYSEIETIPTQSNLENVPFSFSLPLPAEGQLIDSLGSSMEHNPAQANSPLLPPEVLEKLVVVARAFGLEDASALKAPEPGCHCMYCQFTRALKGETKEEEIVKEEDLRFRDWEVSQKAEKLYIVTNPLDANEQYNVFLGEPLGCTCGQKHCEHVRAVLST